MSAGWLFGTYVGWLFGTYAGGVLGTVVSPARPETELGVIALLIPGGPDDCTNPGRDVTGVAP